jgi:hypothetical protein
MKNDIDFFGSKQYFLTHIEDFCLVMQIYNFFTDLNID